MGEITPFLRTRMTTINNNTSTLPYGNTIFGPIIESSEDWRNGVICDDGSSSDDDSLYYPESTAGSDVQNLNGRHFVNIRRNDAVIMVYCSTNLDAQMCMSVPSCYHPVLRRVQYNPEEYLSFPVAEAIGRATVLYPLKNGVYIVTDNVLNLVMLEDELERKYRQRFLSQEVTEEEDQGWFSRIRNFETMAQIKHYYNVVRVGVQGSLQNTVLLGIESVDDVIDLSLTHQKLIEDCILLVYQLVNVKSTKEAILVVFSYLKYSSQECLLSKDNGVKLLSKLQQLYDWCKDLFRRDIAMQSEGDWPDMFSTFDANMLSFGRVKDSECLKHILQIITRVLSLMCTFDISEESKIQGKLKALKKTWEVLDFTKYLTEVISYFINKGYECYTERSILPFFGGRQDAVVIWHEKCVELVADSKKLNNAAEFNINLDTYFGSLTDAMVLGRELIRNCKKHPIIDASAIRRVYIQLVELSRSIEVRKSLQSLREAPHVVLVMGPSSIGKSLFKNVLFHSHCKWFDLPEDDYYCYYVNPLDDFLSQYRSDKHTMVLDDIGFMHPNKVQGMDTGIAFIMQASNNVACSSNQAELQDKGMIPLRPKSVLASTNVPDLNAHIYFNNEKAPRRRFNLNVELIVKPEYATPEGNLNSVAKSKNWHGEWPDMWLINVYDLVPTGAEPFRVDKQCHEKVKFVKRESYTNINDFLEHYRKSLTIHKREQGNFMSTHSQMRDLKLCSVCGWIVCNCVVTQSDDVVDFDFINFADRQFDEVAREVHVPRFVNIPEEEIQVERDRKFLVAVTCLCSAAILISIIQMLGLIRFAVLILCLVYYGYTKTVMPRFFIKGVVRRVLMWFMCHKERDAILIQMTTNQLNSWWERGRFIRTKRVGIAVVALIGTYAFYSAFTSKSDKKQREVVVQGLSQSTLSVGTVPVATANEKINPWKRDSVPITVTDFGNNTITSKGQYESIKNIIDSRVCRLCIFVTDGIETRRKGGSALRLVGPYLLFNAHFVPTEGDNFRSEIIFPSDSQQPPFKFTFCKKYLKTFKDLAIYRLESINRTRDIRGFFPCDKLKGKFTGDFIGRDIDGRGITHRVSEFQNSTVTYLGIKYDCWKVNMAYKTQKGDCGAVYLADTPVGPTILGIHTFMLANGEMSSQSISQKEINYLLNQFSGNLVQPNPVRLNAENTKLSLGELHDKSPIRFIQDANVEVYGSIVGASRPGNKSRVSHTMYHDYFKERGFKCNYGRPVMRGWKVNDNIIRPLLSKRPDFDEELLMDIGRHLGNTLSKVIDINMIHTYDIKTAINGVPGVAFVDRLNMKTSTGHPWNTCKKKMMVLTSGDDQFPTYEFEESIMNEIEYTVDAAYKGMMPRNIYTLSKKDEARTLEKIENHNTRGFMGASTPTIVAQRMLFGGLIRAIQAAGVDTGIAIGIDAHGATWGKLADRLNTFRNKLDGDYKKFDTIQIAKILCAAKITILLLLRIAGFSSEDLLAAETLLDDAFWPVINMEGDVFCPILGLLPSGFSLTALFNSIVNLILLRYVFVKLHHISCEPAITSDILDLYELNVRDIVYGDDNVVSVSDDVPWYNHAAMVEQFAMCGVTYTSADKKTEQVGYKGLECVEFLKRKFTYHSDLNRIVGPLAIDSINKSLMFFIPSESLDCSVQQQHRDNLMGQLRELVYHGRSTYNTYLKYFIEVNTTYNLGAELYDYENALLKARLDASPAGIWGKSDLSDALLVTAEFQSENTEIREWTNANLTLGRSPNSRTLRGDVSVTSKFLTCAGIPKSGCCIAKYRLDKITREGLMHFLENASNDELERLEKILTDCTNDDDDGAHDFYLEDIWAEQLSRDLGFEVEFQSEDILVEAQALIDSDVNQTATFRDVAGEGEIASTKSSIMRGALTLSTSDRADLGEFLKRPVKLATISWLESDATGTSGSFDPWTLFLNDPKVKNKLNNFSWFNGRMRIKAVMNASPFYYGAGMLSYQPYGGYAAQIPTYDATNTHFVQYSQLKHVWVMAQHNVGGILDLPFIYPKDYINIQSASAVATLGRIGWNVFTQLQSANGAVGSGVTIQIYGWFEDFNLDGPSMGVSMQGDEYSEGMISRPASAIANIAGKLEGLPVIGIYATATKFACNAVAGIAKLFGYTVVPNLADVDPYRPSAFPTLAASCQKYPIDKLTIDNKAELGINPMLVGSEHEDHLVITRYAGHESFLTSFAFNTASVPDDILFSMAVTPMLFRSAAAVASTAYWFTPMAHAASMFEYWRGTIHVNIKTIASVFHKGRIIIGYDPSGQGTNTMVNDPKFTNGVFSEVIDITPDGEIDLRIPYCQAVPFCQTSNTTGVGTTFTTGAGFLYKENIFNGTLTVRVITALSAPLATSTINFLVSVRAGDDFELAGPRTPNNNTSVSYIPFQGDDAGASSEIVVNSSGKSDEHQYLVNFGERVVSLRQLLNRFCFSRVDYSPTATGTSQNIVRVVRNLMPTYYGFDPHGLDTAINSVPATVPFNWSFNTSLNWLSPCFLGYRGSVNWCFNVDSPGYTVKHLRVYRDSDANTPTYGTSITNINSASTVNQSNALFVQNTQSGISGQALTNSMTQAGLVCQVPMYSAYKYYPTYWGAATNDVEADTSFCHYNVEYTMGVAPTRSTACLHSYVAAGTDFSLVQFQFIPTFYVGAFPAT